MTSPPYLGHRRYGTKAGEIGQEGTIEEYVASVLDVIDAAKPALKPDATVWLNVGDGYVTHGHGRPSPGRRSGLHEKQMMLIPERIGLEAQRRGWWVRSRVVWHRTDAKPESVADRPGGAHETVWMLTRNARYWYDPEAVREGAGEEGANEGGEIESRARARGHEREEEGLRQLDRIPRRRQVAHGHRMRNVWAAPRAPGVGVEHRARMHDDVARRCILAGSRPQGTVLDPFAGSGTTGAVAMAEGRSTVLIEIEPRYAATCAQRLGDVYPLFSRVTVEDVDATAARRSGEGSMRVGAGRRRDDVENQRGGRNGRAGG